MAIARSSLMSARRTIAAQTALSESQRAEALRGIDSAIAQLGKNKND